MVHELKKSIESGSVLFGIRQTLKNNTSLQKAIITTDCRDATVEQLNQNKIPFEELDMTKEELTSKLELAFQCEVFGLRK